MLVAAGVVGEVFARATGGRTNSISRPQAGVRLAFNARNPVPTSDLRPRADQSALVKVREVEALRRAAEQGFAEAQYTLGCCYNGDEGFPKDPGEAAKWWGQAAAQGHADAQYCLGLSCFMGEGVARNPAEAAKWWRQAAEQDHADAQYFLGLSYSLGLGVPKTEEQAIHWLTKAAIKGNENATAALQKLGKGGDLPLKKQSAARGASQGK